MLANVATSAASQRFSAPDDAQAARGTSYAQTCSPGWTPAFRGLLRGCRAAPAVGPTVEAASCAAVAARARNVGGWGHPRVLPSLAASSGRTSGQARRALPSSGFRGKKGQPIGVGLITWFSPPSAAFDALSATESRLVNLAEFVKGNGPVSEF